MKGISTEVIEIGGKEYTLFLNRKGIVAFEKASEILKTANEIAKKYKDAVDDELVIDPNANPIEMYGEDDGEDEDTKKMREVFVKFYWIALYENHHFNLEQTRELFDEAEKEYGIEQLIELGYQMIDDVNKEPEATKLKNLKALRPKTQK